MQLSVLPSRSISFILQWIIITMRLPNVVVAVAHFHMTVVADRRIDVDQVHDDHVSCCQCRDPFAGALFFLFLGPQYRRQQPLI
jgi:hypothetical protein